MNINNTASGMMDVAGQTKGAMDLNNLKSKVSNANKEKNDKELKEACNQFENYFLDQIMKEMRKTLSEDGEDSLIPKGKGEQTFTEMMDSEFSKKATETGGVGLAKLLYEQLKKQQ